MGAGAGAAPQGGDWILGLRAAGRGAWEVQAAAEDEETQRGEKSTPWWGRAAGRRAAGLQKLGTGLPEGEQGQPWPRRQS